MRGTAIATAVLLVSTSAYTAPVTLVCNGKLSSIRWDAKAPAGRVI